MENVPGEDGWVAGRSYRSRNHHLVRINNVRETKEFGLIFEKTSRIALLPRSLPTYRDDDRDMVG